MSTLQGTAVVTGASSGIGAVYADRLAARGYDLVLVARNKARLEEKAAALRARHGRAVRVLAADLADSAQRQAVETLLRTDESITLLVNNAGIGSAASLFQADIADMDRMLDINVTALTHLAYAAAPAFAARGKGSIVNISSIVAVAPELLNGVYGASKAYVLAFSQSLKKDLADKGVHVQVVLPGATATEFWDLAGLPVTNLPEAWVMSAEMLVDAALLGFDRGEFVTIPSLHDGALFDRFEAARQAMQPQLSNAAPAPRYALTKAA